MIWATNNPNTNIWILRDSWRVFNSLPQNRSFWTAHYRRWTQRQGTWHPPFTKHRRSCHYPPTKCYLSFEEFLKVEIIQKNSVFLTDENKCSLPCLCHKESTFSLYKQFANKLHFLKSEGRKTSTEIINCPVSSIVLTILSSRELQLYFINPFNNNL